MMIRPTVLPWVACILALGSALSSSGASSAAADSGRGFEIADYYSSAFVGGPALSPDGEEVVFSVRRYDLDQEESWSNLWRIRSDGTGLQQLTFGRQNDGSASFSKDGQWIYFSSDRGDAGTEIYRISTRGGEAQAVTDTPLDLGDPLVSADGKWLVVTAEVYPDCGIDPECNEARDKSREGSSLEVHMTDVLLYRHWTSWSDGKVSHVLLVDAETGEIVRDLTPGPYPAPTFSAGGARGYDFAPDSRHLCFVSNHDQDQATSTNADLWWIDVEDEESVQKPQKLTEGNRGFDGAPLISPDGKSIAFLSQKTAGYESDLYRIATYDLSSASVSYLTSRATFDNLIGDLRWSPDGKALYFEAEVDARGPIYRLELKSKKVRKVLVDGVFNGWQVSPDGRSLVYTRSHIGSPFELFRASLRGGRPQALTHFNDPLLQEVDFRSAEEIRVPSGRGYDIHCWVIKPHGFDPSRSYPTIVNVHGGPQGSWNDRYRGDWQVYPGKGYVVVLPNPTGSTGFGQDYTDAIAGDWGGRVYDDLMQVVDAVSELSYVDADRIGAMGWSYGGYMMMWMQGHTDRFVCQAAMMGLYDLRSFFGATEELWFPEHDLRGVPWESRDYERWSPSNYAENFATPSLVITGEKDYRVPYTQSLAYFTALQRRGVDSRLVVFPNSGHWPNWHEMIFYYNAHLEWFHRYLGGEPAPYDLEELRNGRVFGEGANSG